MARISTYSSDTSITGVEKLLGTDAGTTKLFSLSDLQTYFTQTVTLSSTLGSDLLPSSDGTFDLGSSSAEWQDLFIDGTANIDSLVADTADINGGTVDGAIIGGSSAAAGTFTTMNATTVQVGGSAISLNNLSNVVISSTSLVIGNIPGSISGAENNIGIGTTALEDITSGDENIAIGNDAGKEITTSNYNIAIGYKALKSNK
jgi:hypothetical protein